MAGSNLLGRERSPYLGQHKDNPVWWHAWGDEAFERARLEDKPVFLSIGYSTCYWCHVMERDSFEREDVARVLNEHFVSIKVDREELPDVDQIYMDVVVGIHGHGGWPMSVFLTPDRKPFWGGTFFYRDSFIRILSALADSWRSDRQRVLVSCEELTQYLRARSASPSGTLLDAEQISLAAEQLLGRFDPEFGGFGAAPKFPPSQQLALLSAIYSQRGDAASKEVVTKTLTALACGGIFDQLGGGFHRYSVDAEWLVPHFEKMLYDNALLVPVFVDWFRVTGDRRFKQVALDTLDYLLRDMRAPEGAFYAAEDAGEVDREGEFYVWTRQEIESVLEPRAAEELCELYRVTAQGNFERGASVLSLDPERSWEASVTSSMVASRAALLAARGSRARPHRDQKILTGWNGLCLTALCRGFAVSADQRYLNAALESAGFILGSMRPGGSLVRRFCDGEAAFEANLEDYAYLVQGLIELYQVSGDARWLNAAVDLADEQHRVLWLAESGAYASSARPGNITRRCEWEDGATPSANSISLSNLIALEALTAEARFAERSELLERGAPGEVAQVPSAYCSLLMAVMSRKVGVSVVQVVGAEPKDSPEPEVFDLWRRYLPFTRVVWWRAGVEQAAIMRDRMAKAGKTTFFVCRNRACSPAMLELERVVEVCSRPGD